MRELNYTPQACITTVRHFLNRLVHYYLCLVTRLSEFVLGATYWTDRYLQLHYYSAILERPHKLQTGEIPR